MKKKFYLKPFLLEKGEVVGLGAAAVLTVILVGMGLLKGLSSGNASDNAKELARPITKLENDQRMAIPDPNAHLPGSLPQVEESFKRVEVLASNYPARSLFQVPLARDNKRQPPELKDPNEFRVQLVRAQLPALAFEYVARGGPRPIPTHVYMVEAPQDKGVGGQPGMIPSPYAPSQLRGLGQMGFGGPPPAVGGGVRRGGADRLYRLGARPEQGAKVRKIPLADADNPPQGLTLATRTLPLRMAIVTASFPYHAQLEEFRQKLRLESHGAVLADKIQTGDKEEQPAFRFRGLIVQRAEFDPTLAQNRNIRVEDWQPKDEDYVTLPLVEDYTDLLVNIAKQTEKDPAALEPIKQISRGLVMELPKQFGSFTYPESIFKLDRVEATLKNLKEDDRKQAAAADSNLTRKDFDPFDLGANTPQGGGNPGNPGVTNPMPMRPMDPSALKELKETPFEYCMIRFVDVTQDPKLEPGKVYHYRFKIRMNNPNYSPNPTERKDTYPQYAREKELVSKNWINLTHPLQPGQQGGRPRLMFLEVPSDTHVYSVADSKQTSPPETTPFQFHRWVESFKPKVGDDEKPIGEWVVASRVNVRRGDFLRLNLEGQKQELSSDLPVKNLSGVNFEVEKAAIPFGDTSILVDFEGGRTQHTRLEPGKTEGENARRVTILDEAATEALIMMPDGRVYSRNSAEDLADTTRQIRDRSYRDRIADLQKKKSGGGTPFGG